MAIIEAKELFKVSREAGSLLFMPDRDYIQALEVGDLAPNAFGELARVASITFRGVDVKGKLFVGYYVEFGNGGTMSHSLKEDRVDRTARLSNVHNSAEIDRLEAEALEAEEPEPDEELRADLDDFIRTSEWVKESDRLARERAEADRLREHVQSLKREADELETPTLRDYAREGFAEADPTRYRDYQEDPRFWEDVLGIAVSAYVRDNGDAVPVEVVEQLKIEIDEENTRRGERADERQGLW